MNIPVNLFMWIMAFLPIAALLILMIKCGWGATEAAPVGLLITVVTGDEAKAFLVIRNGMRKLLPNELLLVLAMGWIFESFLQGITGFGVPVAVGAPLLIGIGVKPLWAVIIPLIGQAYLSGQQSVVLPHAGSTVKEKH